MTEPPTFVVGHHRSGTTWVYELLTSHPSVGGVLESWLFTASSGVVPLFSSAHWDSENQQRHRETIGEVVGLSQLVSREELVLDVRHLAEKWLGSRLSADHRFLVEKTPSPYTDLGVLAEVFPEARFLHVIRDGRDVTVSVRAAATTWNPGWSYASAKGTGGRLRSIRNCARSWEETVKQLRVVGGRLGDRYHEVRYEEMHERPEETIRAMFEFARVPSDGALVEAARDATSFEGHYQGGEDRFRRSGRMGDWKKRFGLLDAVVFEQGSHGALVDYGYADNRLWWTRSRERLIGR